MANVLNIWKEKYGEEEALRKWAEKTEKQRATNKKRMSEMTAAERSVKFGSIGNSNPAKQEHVRKLISERVTESYINNPELKISRSNKMKGSDNPSCKEGASERISNHRKNYFTNPDNRIKVSEQVSKLHQEGKLKSGYTKYYKFQHDGREYIVQGSYELAFIKWLTLNNMKFRCHEDRIKYIDSNGIERIYLPDFYVEEWNSYVDVKSSYWYDIQKDKFKQIISSNPNLNLKIMLESDLTQLNIL